MSKRAQTSGNQERAALTQTLPFVDEEEGEDTFSPEFVRRPKSAYVNEGAPAVFTCQVAAEPPPAVCWEKDGQVIVNGGRYRVRANSLFSTCMVENVFER